MCTKIEQSYYRDWAERAQLPQMPKPFTPTHASSNIAVTFFVSKKFVYDKPAMIRAMLDAGDMMIGRTFISCERARATFVSHFTCWVIVFENSVFTIYD